MSLQTGVTMKVLVNQFDVTGYFRKMDLDCQRSLYDTTVFGSNSKSFVPGLNMGTIGVEGLFESIATANAPDNVFAAIEAASTFPLVSVAPAGLGVGNRVYLLQAHENHHDIGAEIDALVLNRAQFTDNDGYDFGVSLHPLTAETSLPVAGTSVDNAAATSNGGVAFLHVTDSAGLSMSVIYKVQHATDNATWVDLVTFAPATVADASRSQRVVVAAGTTVRRYLRMTATENGTTTSVTGSVSFARR